MFKCDMHVHSKHSKKPTNWILKKFACPESFVEPRHIYATAKARGMTHVTITDHNSIGGILEIISLPGTFMGCEFTCHFPDDHCKVHVLAYDFTKAQWEEMMTLRLDIYKFLEYCKSKGIFHAVAHPLYSVNDKLTVERARELTRLFSHYEQNGMRSAAMNRMTSAVFGPGAYAIGGSDDHSGAMIAKRHTVHPSDSLKDMLDSPAKIEVAGSSAEPYDLAYSLYSIGYQYLRDKMDISFYVRNDETSRSIDRMLTLQEGEGTRINTVVRKIRGSLSREHDRGDIQGVLYNSLNGIAKDASSFNMDNAGRKWFDLASKATDASAKDLLDYTLEQLESGNIFNIFRSIGSISSMYFLLSPYYMAYNIFSQGQSFAEGMAEGGGALRIGHYTDTFYEINGVARTLRQTLLCAKAAKRSLEIATCSDRNPVMGETVFKPVKTYELPEYPELKAVCPPVLEMLHHAYSRSYTHIHTATPGMVGLVGLVISKILKKPLFSTYHTAFPQYVKAMTGEKVMEDATWQYMTWYYRQCERIFVPSRTFKAELVEHGVDPERVFIMPRGVDSSFFRPAGDGLKDPSTFTILYVGRISKEKNLDILAEAFKRLNRPDLRLRVIGGGPYRHEMEESLKGYHAEFTGYLEGESLLKEYQRADLFVFPSTTDTFGNVILEAHSCGLPTLVTDIGGPAENVEDGVTGAIVKGGDVHSLKEGVERLLDKPLLSKMGAAARGHVENLTFERAFDEWWNLHIL